uniref:Tudor domain-containing protein n=1 Tax=Bursaphelenchus xylophilus TaxID=6326 RepID=A0A1I7SFG9_BURXY
MFVFVFQAEFPLPERRLTEETEVLKGSEPLWIPAKLIRTGNGEDAAIFLSYGANLLFLCGEWAEFPLPERRLTEETEVLKGSEPLWIPAKLIRTGNGEDAAIFCIMQTFSRI